MAVLCLAPMAGVTDATFRALCTLAGAEQTTCEMISAKAITKNDAASFALSVRGEETGRYLVQIFASQPETAAEAVKRIAASTDRIDGFDLNAGCPAPKIVTNGCGSALMKNPPLLGKITEAMARATSLPVSVKLRAGFDAEHVNAPLCARVVQESGAQSVAVHGRTRDRMYAPPVDYGVIAAVKAATSLPVYGNGDIFTPDDAAQMLRLTQCDGILIGRGALGRPWIFTQIAAFLRDGTRLSEPSPAEKAQALLRHIALLAEKEGEKAALLKARKHAAWYTKGIKNAAALRRDMNALSSFDDLRAFAETVATLTNGGDTAVRVNNFS